MKEFTQNQIDFISSRGFIDQKTELTKKVFDIFANFGRELHEQYSSQLELSKSPKVSKGENYNAYPYMMVDYPRLFDQKDVFAFRSMFWWGNFFSSTLHLKGNYLNQFESKISSILNSLEDQKQEIFVSYKGDEWNHNLFSEQYLHSKKASSLFKQEILKGDFLKLSLYLPLSEINDLENFLRNSEHLLLKPLL